MNEATHLQEPLNRQIAYDRVLYTGFFMKILNLYAGIGGNRLLWGNDHDITAIEYNLEIAKEDLD